MFQIKDKLERTAVVIAARSGSKGLLEKILNQFWAFHSWLGQSVALKLLDLRQLLARIATNSQQLHRNMAV